MKTNLPTAIATFITGILGPLLMSLSLGAQPALVLPGQVTGAITNGQWAFYRIDVPATNDGFRVVLHSDGPGATYLHVQTNAPPTNNAYVRVSYYGPLHTMAFTEAEATNGVYFIGVFLPASPRATNTFTLSAERPAVTPLAWDPGTSATGSEVFTNQSASGGDYHFKINPPSTDIDAWRTVLRVQTGEANLALTRWTAPTIPASLSYASSSNGSDGLVLPGTSYTPGEDWLIRVSATPGAQWTLFSGRAFAHDLGALAADGASGTNVVIGPERLAFFKTTVPAETLAWRLWLNGANQTLYVRKSFVPLPAYPAYELSEFRQMLVVPDYLAGGTFNGFYFVAVPGEPGTAVALDSRQQPITDIPFNSTNGPVNVSGYGYTTYRVSVPVRDISWQISVVPHSGDPSLVVRRDKVPNAANQDACSAVREPVTDSITLVPPALTDGIFYITVHSSGPHSFTLENREPVVTAIPFVGSITNTADAARAGWIYYVVRDITNQLDSLGWELALRNHVPGTQIALRRNFVPGIWRGCAGAGGGDYHDFLDSDGCLQRPGHPADIWYVGIYSPNTALGNFELTTRKLTAPLDAGVFTVTNLPPAKWSFHRVDVPADQNLRGVDLRVVPLSGNVEWVVRRGVLPDAITTSSGGWEWAPNSATTWAERASWAAQAHLSGFSYDSSGRRLGQELMMIRGNPLEPGTYYVGVKNSSASIPASFEVRSRGLGEGYARPVGRLGLNESVTTNLPPGEAAWFHLETPAGLTNWTMRLTSAPGECRLLRKAEFLPGSPYSPASGLNNPGLPLTLAHPGEERYVVFLYATNTLGPNSCYVVVISEGQNPTGNSLGSNSTTFTLANTGGAVPIHDLGVAGPVALVHSNALPYGDYQVYEFQVPTGVVSMELRLERVAGGPAATMCVNCGIPAPPSDYYGRYTFVGGDSSTALDDLVTQANPPPGVRRVMVKANAWLDGANGYVHTAASYVLRVTTSSTIPLALDGGIHSVSNQPPDGWQFFSFDVPADPGLRGWDVRVIPSADTPLEWVVRRDLLPDSPGTVSSGWEWFPNHYTNWPSGAQWGAQGHLSSWAYDADGRPLGKQLTMIRGNPLEPGRYYLGVKNTGPTNAAYTVRSRGMGAGYTIPVGSLGINTTVTTNLPAGEAAWFQLDLPEGKTNWVLRLNSTNGGSHFLRKETFLPGTPYSPAQWWVSNPGNPVRIAHAGEERYTTFAYTQTLAAASCFVAIVSEGEGATAWRLGSNSTTLTLSNEGGAVPVINLGTVGAADLTHTNALLHGDYQVYEFIVPGNTLSMELRLENKTGNPQATLLRGGGSPAPNYSYGPYLFTGSTYQHTLSDLLTLANPTFGPWRVTVVASGTPTSAPPAGYTLRVSAVAPIPLELDGGMYTVSNQLPNTWRYFPVTVPAETNLLGWDVRVTPLAGTFNWVVRRGTLPDAIGTTGYWCPSGANTWPAGNQWGGMGHFSGYYYDARTNVLDSELTMAMGNPLEPGTYYIGVLSTGAMPASYTVRSRGIGIGYSVPVTPLPLNGAVTATLPAGELAWYRVEVPAGQTNWALRLTSDSAESALRFRKRFLPGSAFGGGNSWICYDYPLHLGHPGEERYEQLAYTPPGAMSPGVYYLAVVSEGEGPRPPWYLGSNSTTFTLTSRANTIVVTNLGTVGAADLVASHTLAPGEYRVVEFTVPTNTLSMEVRLENKTGNPQANIISGSGIPKPDYYFHWQYPFNPYYFEGGNYGDNFTDLLTFANPPAGLRRVTVVAAGTQENGPIGASYALRVRTHAIPDLNIDAGLNTNGLSHTFAGTLAANQRAYFRVDVPATLSGLPVLGWRLDLEETNGTPSVRVRHGFPPDDRVTTNSPWASRVAVIAPPFLTPGTWYGEIKGSAANTAFALRSSAVTLGTLERPAWVIPGADETNVAPGLAWPEFGDTGTDAAGTPLPGDRGVNLEDGRLHFYAVLVPTNNAGLLRTQLEAISGNPNLYIRTTNAPTFTHCASGVCGQNEFGIYERSLTGTGTEYGNWVPLAGITQTNLTPGLWVLAVHAAGGSNVRYRLRLSAGDIQDLALESGSFTNQLVAGGDWRYYRVQVPRNVPANWLVTFSQQVGDVVMHVRDTVPPGYGGHAPTFWASDNRDWDTDYKNQWNLTENGYDAPGTHTLSVPPLRPGHTYYLGFRGVAGNNEFSVSTATGGGPISVDGVLDFYTGSVTNMLPPGGRMEFRVDVPADAARWKNMIVRSSAVGAFIEQGTRATGTGYDHWRWGELNTPLNAWPWLPGYSYWILLTNTSALPQPFSLTMNGCNDATCDEDNDGLPDRWELNCFSNLAQTAIGDPDLDGVTNLDEFREDTVPCDGNSFRARLNVTTFGGSVVVIPALSNYALGTVVTLTATPNAGFTFSEWIGSVTSSANPLTLTMDGHKSITARFQREDCRGAPTGLVSWWTGDGESTDVNGTNDATLVNDAGYAPGLLGGAFSLDGVNDYVQVGNPSSLRLTSRLTVMAWIYPTGPGSSGSAGGVVFNKEGEYGIWRFPNGAIQWAATGGSGSDWAWVNTGFTAPPNGWSHLVFTFDAGVVRVYANGALVSQRNLTGTTLGDFWPGHNDLRIGGRHYPVSEYFAGLIDDVAIFDRALSPGEIAAIHAAGSFCGVTIPQLSAPTRLPDGRFQFDLRGLAGYRYVIEATSDLSDPLNWSPASLMTNATGLVTLIDDGSAAQSLRFYRARLVP